MLINISNKNLRYILFCTLLSFITLSQLHAQNIEMSADTFNSYIPFQEHIQGRVPTTPAIEEYIRLNQEPEREKVFVQTDRLDYMAGDTIWFKAYSWFGYEQMPNTISGVQYVDLVNPSGRVEIRRKVLVENGTSYGEFGLDTTISPGIYTLRAYTRRMQNVNTGEAFCQTLTVNPSNQNFQIDFTPVIVKYPGNDTLVTRLSLHEIDRTGDLKSAGLRVDYSLKMGDRIITSDYYVADSSGEQTLKFSIPSHEKDLSDAVFDVSVRGKELNIDKQYMVPLHDRIDLQFFPEGGNLIMGLKSKIGFKAIGTDGLSREVTGYIETQDGEFIADFESAHKGMGCFLLKPEHEKKYFAHLWYNKQKYIIPLPEALEGGVTMRMGSSACGKDQHMTVMKSLSATGTRKYLVGSAYGKIWFSALFDLVNDSCRLRIPLELLPEGICRLTILNSDFKPECERLIYTNKNQTFKIEIKPDSLSYGARSKVRLFIKTLDMNGNPVKADLSIAVTDMEQTAKSPEAGIREYKLLQSELRGYIEDAHYYFMKDSCVNTDNLDLLLLTQGYRKFLPGPVNPDEQKFQPEISFDISGYIKFKGSKARERKFSYQDINLLVMSNTEQAFIEQFSPDSIGKFDFKVPLLHGNLPILLQARTQKDKPFYGDIYINDMEDMPRFTPMMQSNYNNVPSVITQTRRLQAIKKTKESKIPPAASMSFTLEEVTVKAKAKNWYRHFDKEAMKIADLDSLDPTGKGYETVYDLLIKEFGAREYLINRSGGIKTILLPCVSIGPSEYFPIYVMNGRTIFNAAERGEMFLSYLEYISSIPVNEIKRIMVLPPGNIASYYADPMIIMDIRQSLVVIETYSGNKMVRGDPEGIKTFLLEGLDVPRAFYSPEYTGPAKTSPVYDGRASLYWNPSVSTDSTGQAEVSFYTSDRRTSWEIKVNGIEIGSGYPGEGRLEIHLPNYRLNLFSKRRQ